MSAPSMPLGSKAMELFKDRNLFQAQKIRGVRERARERKNWRFYDGTDYGQWDEAAVRLLIQEGRPPHTFNFIETKVDTIVGSMLTDEYQLSFETELGEKNNPAIMLNELFMEDKDLCNFDFEFLQFIRAGFVYRGYLQFYVNRTKDPRGRLAWRYLPPDRVQVDVDWKTNDINDCKWIFVSAWMSPEQIKAKYKAKGSEVQSALDQWEMGKSESTTQTELEKVFDRSDEFFDQLNGLYLVIEKYEMKETTKVRMWDPLRGEFLPDQDEEDGLILQQMASLQGQRLEMLPKTTKECYCHTFCPGISLSISLAKGKTELQTGGYPILSYASNMINGHPNTLVDQLRDAQEAYNKRVSTATHILMTSANNALLIESDAVEDATELERIGKQRGRPGAYFIVEPGAISGQKVKHLEKNQPPSDFAAAADQILAVAQQLTPAVPAVQAQNDQNGGESGIHFQSKLAQAQVAMQIPQKFLKAVWHMVGESYFAAVKQHYTYPMLFQSNRQGVPFYLNVPGGIMVEELSRLKVIINQSPNSDTYRRQLLQQFVALAQYLPDPATKMALTRLMLQSLPGVPDEDLDKLSETAKLSEDYQKLLLVFQTNQLASQIQMQAMQNQMMMAGGTPGMGMGPPGMAPGAPPGQGGSPPSPTSQPGATAAGGPPPPGNSIPGAGPSPEPKGFMHGLPGNQQGGRPGGI